VFLLLRRLLRCLRTLFKVSRESCQYFLVNALFFEGVGVGTSKESTPDTFGEVEWRFHLGKFISGEGYMGSPRPYSGE